VAHVRTFSLTIKPEDIEPLSSLLIDHVNVLGRFEFALKESVRQGLASWTFSGRHTLLRV
jgi:hypothetical protein